MKLNSLIDWKVMPEHGFLKDQFGRGMNFGAGVSYSVFLIVDKNDRGYTDVIMDNGSIIYEGHDEYQDFKKEKDQPILNKDGTQSENGKFIDAWRKFQKGERDPAIIKVYRKVDKGVWVDLGFYQLIGVFKDNKTKRTVYKFNLKPCEFDPNYSQKIEIPHERKIPGHVMKKVFIRDKGKCKNCNETSPLHYDHILPYSKGGSSTNPDNIQLLCERCNLNKGDQLPYWLYKKMQIISYNQLVINEDGKQVQKGMNFGIQKSYSIVLMSTEKNSPYNDEIFDDGVIEYEGHDVPKNITTDKKSVDQPISSPRGTLTENGKFYNAAENYKEGKRDAAKIKVYRKIRPGVWVDMGFYNLVDGYTKHDGKRNVFKFLLEPTFEEIKEDADFVDLLHNRSIPGEVQREVYERDNGKCIKCGSNENLHFDHILPFSKGGSSKIASNIQLLCAKHNLQKGAKFI